MASEKIKRTEVSGHDAGWCGVKVIIDDATTDLFAMPAHNADSDQKPAFYVTKSTADLVGQDFERYKPSLERMANTWQEEKKRFMEEQKPAAQSRADVG
ncbi:MAG: hypothetical protein H0V27_03490 [Pyrinomonadaceae bacterium]|nr:hypothetical protein [Pyrinomonadaceae bacterium]